MSDRIEIKGVSEFGYHGVFEQERRNGQEFLVDVVLFLDLSRPSVSDDLDETINYATVCEAISEEITGQPVALIERLAGRISERLLVDFASLERVHVTVHKPSAPVDQNFGDIFVTIERSR
jgi:dihydroneopterin aldolase